MAATHRLEKWQTKTKLHNNRATKWATTSTTTTRQRQSDKGCSVWAATTFSEGSKRAQTVKLTPPFGRGGRGSREGAAFGLMAATCWRKLKQKVTHRPPQGGDHKGLLLISQVAHTPREPVEHESKLCTVCNGFCSTLTTSFCCLCCCFTSSCCSFNCFSCVSSCSCSTFTFS